MQASKRNHQCQCCHIPRVQAKVLHLCAMLKGQQHTRGRNYQLTLLQQSVRGDWDAADTERLLANYNSSRDIFNLVRVTPFI